jgi:hypothetical protein
MTEVS